jgi:surfactin family lipopeptide synthetase C
MRMENIEDLYELSPLQQGLLFHTLYAPKSGVYFEQYTLTFQGDLNVPALEQAWHQVVNRHPVLRTSFYWEGFDKPFQAVNRQVSPALEQHDWRELSPGEQQQRLELWIQADRERGSRQIVRGVLISRERR